MFYAVGIGPALQHHVVPGIALFCTILKRFLEANFVLSALCPNARECREDIITRVTAHTLLKEKPLRIWNCLRLFCFLIDNWFTFGIKDSFYGM